MGGMWRERTQGTISPVSAEKAAGVEDLDFREEILARGSKMRPKRCGEHFHEAQGDRQGQGQEVDREREKGLIVELSGFLRGSEKGRRKQQSKAASQLQWENPVP